MAMVTVNGVRIAYEMHGAEEVPLVMVHGSWESRRTWDPMIPRLAESFRVLVYDRRGHGESERPSGQGSVGEDVADLAALIESLGLAPAWVAGQSFGGSITLRLAASGQTFSVALQPTSRPCSRCSPTTLTRPRLSRVSLN